MPSSELEINILEVVPKLKGEANYIPWINTLKWALKSKDPVYWDILTGKKRPPTVCPAQYATDDESLRQMVSQDENIPVDTVTPQQIVTARGQAIQRNTAIINSFEAEKLSYDTKNYALLSLLCSLLEASAQKQIVNSDDAFGAYQIIQSLYHVSNGYSMLKAFTKVSTLRYHADGNHHQFLGKWRSALAELRHHEAIQDSLEWCMFLRTIQGNPELQPFIAQIIDQYDDTTMINVYTKFNAFECLRKAAKTFLTT